MNRRSKSCFSRSLAKRGGAVLLGGALLLGQSGCGSQRTTDVRIGVALYQQNDTFISTVVENLELQARAWEEETSRKLTLNITDGGNSQSTQNDQVDRFLDRDYDAICVNIVDRTAAAVLIDKAEAANVPIIFFNRQPVQEDLNRWEGAYYVGARAEESGEIQGQIVADAWKADPAAVDRNGDGVLQYVMLEGEPGHQDTLLRTEYSVNTLTETVPAEKLASDTANWDRTQASARMTEWIKRYGEEIEVVFANNDDMALGAIDACRAAGMTELPFIVGVDATPPALEAIEAGTLKGTVLNDAEGMAEAMFALIRALAAGEDPAQSVELEEGHYIWMPYRRVTAETIASE